MFSRCTKKTGGRARKRHESETCSDATALVTVIPAPVLRPFVFLNSILPLASWDPLHHLCSLGRIYARLEGQEFFNPWHDWRGGGIRSIEYREGAKILFKYETYAGNRTSLVPSDGIYYPLPNDLIILSPFRKKGGRFSMNGARLFLRISVCDENMTIEVFDFRSNSRISLGRMAWKLLWFLLDPRWRSHCDSNEI